MHSKHIYDRFVQASRTKEEAAIWPIMTPKLPAVCSFPISNKQRPLEAFLCWPQPSTVSITKQKLDCDR